MPRYLACLRDELCQKLQQQEPQFLCLLSLSILHNLHFDKQDRDSAVATYSLLASSINLQQVDLSHTVAAADTAL